MNSEEAQQISLNIQPEEIIEPNADEEKTKFKNQKMPSQMMSQQIYDSYNLQQKLDRQNSNHDAIVNQNQNKIECQNQAEEDVERCDEENGQPQQQAQYEYQEYAEEGDQNYEYQIQNMGLAKIQSSDHNYQYEMTDLLHLINKEVTKVQELTGFNSEWALVYYQSCGWKLPLVQKFIDQKGTNRTMISYNSRIAQIASLSGQCPICCLEEKIIYKNSCGDQFCQDCWKGQLIQRMKYHKDPFPPCLNEDCSIRASPFICRQIGKADEAFKRLYERTLCRSYANGSTSVKICKGREKVSCDKCFHVKKIFELIECQTCANLVCARCGQQYHQPAECYDGKNWRKICQDSTNFIQNLDYRVCPYCKQAVERKSGCNSIVCACKQVFCYICGQKWFPNHNQHGVCYRQAQIKKLRQQKQKKLQNQKQYTDKLQKFKAELQPVLSMIRKLEEIDTESQKHSMIKQFHILSNELHYLKQLKMQLKVALLVWKNSIISLYFTPNLIMESHCESMKPLIHKVYDFFMEQIPSLLQAFTPQSVIKTKRVVQMREQIKNPQQFIAKTKIQQLNNMKSIQKFISN